MTNQKLEISKTSIALLFLLLALIISSALDTFFSTILEKSDLVDWPFTKYTWLAIFQLVTFFVLLARFYGGAYRFHQQQDPNQPLKDKIVNIVGTFLLFSFFYVTSLTIWTTDMFFVTLFGMHVIDFIWFIIVIAILDIRNGPLINPVSKFLLWDVLTIFAYIAIYLTVGGVWIVESLLSQWLLILVLLSISMIDWYVLRDFYFDTEKWRKDWDEKNKR